MATTAPVLETLAPLVGGTPDEVERYRKIAEALMAQAGSGEPVEHWMEGVGRLAQALSGTLNERKAAQMEKGGEAEKWANITAGVDAGLFGGGGGEYAGSEYGETADVPGTEAVSSAPTSDVEAYIRQSAVRPGKRRIDPDIAVQVARSEGLAPGVWQSRLPNPKGGGREPSYGPFQLYTGGGLGNVFQRQTGLDPRDPSTVKAQIDFALDQARQGGWTPWHGAKRVGIGRWQGIERDGGETADIPGAEPVGSEPSPDVAEFLGQPPAQPEASLADRQALIAKALAGPAEDPAAVAADVRKYYAGTPTAEPVTTARPPLPRPPVGETAGIPGAEPIGFAPSPDVMAHITGGGAAPAGISVQPTPTITGAPPPAGAGTIPLPPAAPIMRAPPPGGAGTVPLPPVAAPPPHPLVARVPQPRPAPPVAPAAPATTGTVAAPAPARPVYAPPVKNDYNAMPGRPPAAMPMRPGQLMQEPYSGPMSAQEFARQGQAAMRARRAGQQPTGLAQALQAPTPGGQPQQPRRNLLQALLGRGGPQGAGGAPAAPVAPPAPAGGTAAPMDPRRAALARVLADPRVPDALKLAAIKNMTPAERKPIIMAPGSTAIDPVTHQPVYTAPDKPEKRETAKDENDILRYLDTGEPVFGNPVPGGKTGLSKEATTLRNEIIKSDNFTKRNEAVPMVNSMLESLNNDVAIADVDFVYGLAKIFDPIGAVRGEDARTIIEKQALPGAFKGILLQALEGKGALSPEMRRELLNVAITRTKQYDAAVQKDYEFYRGIAGRGGVDAVDVLPELVPMGELPEAKTPPVVKGATFTAEEIAKIPENTVVEDTETGKRFRKTGGKLVPEGAP